MPELRGFIQGRPGGGFCTHGGHPSLAGRDPDGQLRTARATAYPGGLGAVIADAVRVVGDAADPFDLAGDENESLSFTPPVPGFPAPDGALTELGALLEVLVSFDAYNLDASVIRMGPDF